MNKLILIVVFSCWFTSVSGQEIGIYYTKNGSKLTGDKPQGYRIAYDQGFALGAYVDLLITPDVTLSIQPGILRVQSTVKIPDLNEELKDSLDLRLDYLTLPLLFKINPVKSKRFYFIGGPSLGFLLESTTTDESGDEQDRSALFRDINLSLNFGFGYKVPVKSLALAFELKYEQGLVNITDFGNPEELFSRVKTQGVNLSIALGLPFKSKTDE